MKGFEFTFESYGIEITGIEKQGNTTMVETKEIAMPVEIMTQISLIEGLDNHIYKFIGISADNFNINNEIRLCIWYEDLNVKNE